MTRMLHTIDEITYREYQEKRQVVWEKLVYAMFLFTMGSVAGWCLEVVYRSICHQRLYIPGFLMGPYCPIYGMGIVLFVCICNHRNKARSFIEIVVYSSALEYVISFLAENMFGKILWDYSDMPLHIGTRVSLVFSLVWGVLGLGFLFAEPLIRRFYEKHRQGSFDLSAGIASAIVLDFILSAALTTAGIL